MQEQTFNHEAQDGVSLFVRHWTPDNRDDVRATIQIVHGMAEHTGRYRRLAEALTDAGYAVLAHDQRGHGKTAGSEKACGMFAESGGWAKVLTDVGELNEWLRHEYPGKKRILLGHSMGSFVTQHYLILHGDTVDAAVLSATDSHFGIDVNIALGIVRAIAFVLSKRYKSWFAETMSFRNFNRPFKPARTGFDWLSRDEAEVDKYVADPYCGFKCSNQLWIDLFEAMKEFDEPIERSQISKELPIYLIAGDADPVAKMGKGPTLLAESYREVGIKDVTLKVYPQARHELFNETNRDEVTADLLDWLKTYS